MTRGAITPRLLTKAQAADYIGVSLGAFAGVCAVAPIALGPDPRLVRYDVLDLDSWIEAKRGGRESAEEYWLGRMADAPEKRAARRR